MPALAQNNHATFIKLCGSPTSNSTRIVYQAMKWHRNLDDGVVFFFNWTFLCSLQVFCSEQLAHNELISAFCAAWQCPI